MFNAGSAKGFFEETAHIKRTFSQILVDFLNVLAAEGVLNSLDWVAGEPRIVRLNVGDFRLLSNRGGESWVDFRRGHRIDPKQLR